MSLESIWMSIGTVKRLWLVWDDLHSSRDRASRSTGSGSISGSCRSAVSLGELFHKSISDVVGGDMDGIGDTCHNQRTLRRER